VPIAVFRCCNVFFLSTNHSFYSDLFSEISAFLSMSLVHYSKNNVDLYSSPY